MPAAHHFSSHQRDRIASAAPEDLGTAVLALLVAAEGLPERSPASTAYRSALRRKGKVLVASGGSAELAHVLGRVRACGAIGTDAHEAILDAAWTGLPGWRR